MKREAMGHTKMKRLCRRLDIPLWQAVGLMETIWHLTARETPRGDIGKLSDEDIALGIDYRGDESQLIEILVSTGWVDRDPVARLRIHDWDAHADDAVHMRLARSCEFFCSGRAPKYARLAGKDRERAHAFYTACAQNEVLSAPPEPEPLPEPVPEPEPEPVVKDLAAPKNGSASPHGSRFSLSSIPDEWVQFSVEDPKLHWTPEKAHEVFERFSDYWKAKAGASARKVDWLAAWRFWCREQRQPALEFQKKPTRQEINELAFERMRNEN